MTRKTIEPTCPACNDTGRDSTGGPCHPCLVNGRQPLRDAVLGAVAVLFVEYTNKLPTEEQVIKAVKWAFGPKVMYAAGYRDKDGGMGMFNGPHPDFGAMLNATPPGGLMHRQCGDPRPAYIVKLTTTIYNGELIIEPVARWKDGRWQTKKRR